MLYLISVELFIDFSMPTTAREKNLSYKPPAIINLQRETHLTKKCQFFHIDSRG
jgi:hypothetical protein